MTPIPYQLQPVQVTSGPNCPRRSDRAAALALLEQARAGLLATVVARSERPAQMKRLMIDRRMAGTSDSPARHQVQVEIVPSAVAAFHAALPGADFVRRGFATDITGDATFYAPDADVLLDDGFAAGYCFHIMESDRSRPNQVGLGFRAANRRRGRVDVEGALWVDSVARSLVDIEFRYVGLDARVAQFSPGGRVQFRELPNGVVLIDRWMLHLVGSERDTTPRPITDVGVSPGVTQPPLYRDVVADVGGELARATWPDGFSWAGSLGKLSLTILGNGRFHPAGSIVRLEDTNYQAVADSTGHVEIADLAPGPYAITIGDHRLDAIGIVLPTPMSFIAQRDETRVLTLPLETAEQFVADRCRRDRRPPGFGSGAVRPDPKTGAATDGAAWVVGRVLNPDPQVLDDLLWTMQVIVGGHQQAVNGASGDIGTDGLFVHCGLPAGGHLAITFRKGGKEVGTVSRVLTDSLNVISVRLSEVERPH